MEIVSVCITFLSVLVAVWFGFRNQKLASENANWFRFLLDLFLEPLRSEVFPGFHSVKSDFG